MFVFIFLGWMEDFFFFFLCIEKLTLKSFLSIKTVRFTGMKIPVLLSAGFNGDPD